MKARLPLFHLVAILFAVNIQAQSFNKTRLDSLLNLLEGKNKAMGSMAVSENGKVIYSKAIGYRFISTQEKITANEKTKYHIGSISKMFTATIIFQLIEEGQLELSTKLDKYYPSIPNANVITIGQMLSHRSGIHSFTDDPAYQQWMIEPKTHEEIISIISASKPEFEPDSKAAYSNSNFVLLGYIIEKICNKPYSKVLIERICSRIGLNDTYYGGKTDIPNNESISYRWMADWEQEPITDLSIPHGAGSILSTSSDLVKFIDALFSEKLIRQKSLEHMKTIQDGYGMGMFQFPYESKKVYGHTGGIDGFRSLLVYFPDDSLAVAYCSNGGTYSINDILIAALHIYFEKPYALPVFTAYYVNPENLDQYTGIYSSTAMPIKITVSKNNGILTGQGTGQAVFALEPVSEHVFKFEMAGIVMRFIPEKHEFILEQGGAKFIYTKDN